MSQGPPVEILPWIMLLACAIVTIGWFACAGLVATFVNRKLARIEAAHPEGLGDPPDSALLLYALAVFFWPAGFLLGAYLMGTPRTARQGRTCVFIGLGYLTVITLGTCFGMAVFGFAAPDLLARMLGP